MTSISTQQPTTFVVAEKDTTVIPQAWTRELSNQFKAQQMKRPSITVSVQPRPASHLSDSASSTEEATVSCASSVIAPAVAPAPSTPSISSTAPKPSHNAFAQPRKQKVSRMSYMSGLMNGMASKHATPQTHGYADIDAVVRVKSAKVVPAVHVQPVKQARASSSKSQAVGNFVRKSLLYSAASLTPGGVGVAQRW